MNESICLGNSIVFIFPYVYTFTKSAIYVIRHIMEQSAIYREIVTNWKEKKKKIGKVVYRIYVLWLQYCWNSKYRFASIGIFLLWAVQADVYSLD